MTGLIGKFQQQTAPDELSCECLLNALSQKRINGPVKTRPAQQGANGLKNR